MRKFLAFLFVLMLSGAVYAQSADVISKILDTDEVTYGQVCYLSAVRQNLVGDDATFEEAISTLYDKGQLPETVVAGEPVYKADLSYIYLQIFPGVKGGLMYRLTKGSPRYAFKQLKADGIFTDKTDPSETSTGTEALDILSACMMAYGSEDECMGMEISE